MKLRPLGDRVLIAPMANRTTSTSGLELVEGWKPEQMGTVIAVGSSVHPLKERIEKLAKNMRLNGGYSSKACDMIRSLVAKEPLCQPGDLVLFSWQAGQEVFDHDADTRYLLLKEDDLIAVIEKEAVPA